MLKGKLVEKTTSLGEQTALAEKEKEGEFMAFGSGGRQTVRMAGCDEGSCAFSNFRRVY